MKPTQNSIETGELRFRTLSGWAAAVVKVVAIGLPLYSFWYIMQLFVPLGLFIYSGTHNAIFLILVLILVFFLVPARKKGSMEGVPWYDLLMIIAGSAGSMYLAVHYEDIMARGGITTSTTEQALGILLILVLMEAVRRTLGWTMVIVSLCFLFYAKFAYLFPGMLNGPEISLGRVMNYVYLSNQGIFGMILGIAATIIVGFITFGGFLGASGAGEVFNEIALSFLGHVRGGAAKVAVIASALMGTITGSPIAEVGIVGTTTIPLMKRVGYSSTFAGAVEAAAASGGVIMPPVMGAVAFVMADFTQLGYGAICLAAVIPALLYFLALYCQIDLRAAKEGLKGLPKSELPSRWGALSKSWYFFIPILVLILLLMIFDYDPIESAYYSVGVLILLSLLNKNNRLTWRKFLLALENTSKNLTDITPMCAVAGIIVGAVNLTGLGVNLSNMLISMSGGSLLVLAILTGVASYILGMGVSAIASYLILAVLVVPAMVQMGVPVIVAHFFILYMGVSMFITPPYAPAAFVAATVARADPFAVGYQAMKLAIVAYLVPFISIFAPALLLQGSVSEILVSAVTAIVAVFALSVGIEGFLLTRLGWLERIVWLAGGLLLFIPKLSLVLPGFVVLAVGLLLQVRKRKKSTFIAGGTSSGK